MNINEFKTEWITSAIDESAVNFAEKFGEYLCDKTPDNRLGRLAMKKGNYTAGASFFEKAAAQTADFDFQENIIDCLEKIDPSKAKIAAQNLITELQKHATDEKAAAEKGHYADEGEGAIGDRKRAQAAWRNDQNFSATVDQEGDEPIIVQG